MISRLAGRDLTDTLGCIACRRCSVAHVSTVDTLRSAMGIVILTEIFFVSAGRLLADIAFTLFCGTRSGGTDLFDGASLTGIAIGTACRAALGIGTQTLQRIQAETVLTGCGDAFPVLTFSSFPACEQGTVIVL